MSMLALRGDQLRETGKGAGRDQESAVLFSAEAVGSPPGPTTACSGPRGAHGHWRTQSSRGVGWSHRLWGWGGASSPGSPRGRTPHDCQVAGDFSQRPEYPGQTPRWQRARTALLTQRRALSRRVPRAAGQALATSRRSVPPPPSCVSAPFTAHLALWSSECTVSPSRTPGTSRHAVTWL